MPDISAHGPSLSPVASISASPVSTPAHKESPVMVDHHGEPVESFRREDLEDGEMVEELVVVETMRVDFPSSSDGFLLESAQTQPCVVVEGLDVGPVQLASAEDGYLVDFPLLPRGLSLENAQM